MSPRPPSTRWHYTPLRTVPRIMEAREIRYMAWRGSHDPPLVWFSSDQVLEPSAAGLFDRDKMAEYAGKIARLAVHADYRLRPWSEVRAMLLPSAMLYVVTLERTGRALGADPRKWWVTERPVGTYCITRAERWDGNRWIPYKPRGWMGDLTASAAAAPAS